MKKITILALHLGYGGIEKCIVNVANGLVEEYDVEIISTYKVLEQPAFNVDERVKVTYLIHDKPNKEDFLSACKNLKIVSIFKEGIKSVNLLIKKKYLMINAIKRCKSDYIISARDIHNKWLGLYGNKSAKKIGWEHNYHNHNEKYINNIKESVKNLDVFVAVSKEQQEFYSKIVKPECIYIPNSITDYPEVLSNLSNNNLISIGRLSHEKGFLDLIDVIAIVKESYPNVLLNLVGDGNERDIIKKRINDLKLNDNVIMHGYMDSNQIGELLLNSSIYVMTSYTESFGIVLLEAASYGIPLISFENSGSKEIISNNWDGFLIENRDKDKMAKKIINLLKDENRRKIMGRNAYKKCLKYDAISIINMWKDLLNE